MELNLDGRVAVVTGSSAGIGRAIATALAREGAQIVLVARRADALDALADELKSMGARRPIPVPLDTTDASAATVLRHSVDAHVGTAHILVNSAGASWPAPFRTPTNGGLGGPRPLGEFSEEEIWMKSLELNFHSNRRLAYGLLPLMVDQGYGRVINITASTEPGPTINASNPAKAAVHAWSKALSNEVGRHGVTVNCVAPGYIMSEQVERAWDEHARARIAERVPVGTFGQPEDVAHVATFLASPLGGYITGEIINVDGGLRRSAF